MPLMYSKTKPGRGSKKVPTDLYLSYFVSVILLCASKTDEHDILLGAKNRGMTNGEYLFIQLEHTPPADILTPWDGLDVKLSGRDSDLFEAYKAVIQVIRFEILLILLC